MVSPSVTTLTKEPAIAGGSTIGSLLKGLNAILFPNWGDVETVRPAQPGAANHFRKVLSLDGKIVLLYSGNMGAKQGLEVLAPLAESFEHDWRVHFVFCGDGAFRPQLEKLVARRKNVTMLPLQSTDRLNDLLNAADIHLLPQSKGAADLVMPSKLNGILSSGRPVIATDLASGGRSTWPGLPPGR